MKEEKQLRKHLVDFLEKNNQKYDKTIMFCQNSEHALAMTKLIRNYSGENHDYCVRIVSAEGEIGKRIFRSFPRTKQRFSCNCCNVKTYCQQVLMYQHVE